MPVPKRIAIVGNGTTTRASDGFDGEIWTTSSVAKILPRVDRIFEVHVSTDPSYHVDRMNSYKCPIMMDGIHPEIEHCVDLRIDDLVKKYRPMFQFSFDYMMALALEMNIKDVTLFGIDLMSDEEHNRYAKSFYYWIGRLEGSGVKVTISEGSLICSHNWQYCHKPDFTKERIKKRMEIIDGKLGEANDMLDEAVSRAEWVKGYRACLEDDARMGG
jgi:hypothetical protein